MLALTSALLVGAMVLIGDMVAIAGCAICDETPPNHLAAGLLTVGGLASDAFIFRGWRAACSSGRYRR